MRTRICLAAASLACLSLPALAAGEVPADAEIALWCGHAFAIVSVELATDDAGASTELAGRSTELLARGTALLITAGFTDAEAATTSDGLKAGVATEISGPGENAKYSYDECIALAE